MLLGPTALASEGTRMAERQEMEELFVPRTIAVAGASNKSGKMGNLLLKRLVAEFPGRILPIHPTEREIVGLEVYPDQFLKRPPRFKLL